MLRREPTGGTLYHAYAKSVENLDANFTNKMATNYLQNCNIPRLCTAVNLYSSTALVKSIHYKTLTFGKDDEKCLAQTGRATFWTFPWIVSIERCDSRNHGVRA